MTTGKDSQLGLAAESTYGTLVAPTEFHRLRSSSLKASRALIEDDGIIAGRLTADANQVCEGDVTVAGAISLPLFRGTKLRTLLENMMGAESGAGTLASPYLYTPTDLEGTSMTVQVGYGGTAGTVHPVNYLGCKVNSWSIGAQAGAKANLELDLIGQDSTDESSGVPATLATASFTRPRTYSFAHASATVGGSSRKVKSVTFSGSNNLDASRRFLGSRLIQEPLDGDLREYTAEVTMEFEDMTDYTNYVAGIGSLVTVVGLFTDGTDLLTVTMAGYVTDPPIPDANGRGPLEASLTLMAKGDGTDASACTIQQNTAT